MNTPMDGLYTPGAIANYFLAKAAFDGVSLTPMQLQKLIYFAHGWYIAGYGKPLIDRPIEAWEFGPVCSQVYHHYKEYGRNPIPNGAFMAEAREAGEEDKLSHIFAPGEFKQVKSGDEHVKRMLDSVWSAYGSQSGITLSNWSHTPDELNPWSKAIKSQGFVRNLEIDNNDIITYFSMLAAQKRLY